MDEIEVTPDKFDDFEEKVNEQALFGVGKEGTRDGYDGH
jgi:hypothetical protein